MLVPRGLDHRVQFTGPTGANAVEAALKLARKVTGRRNVVAFTNGFHGVSQGALAATGNGHHRMGRRCRCPTSPGCPTTATSAGSTPSQLLDELLSDPSSGIDAPAADPAGDRAGRGRAQRRVAGMAAPDRRRRRAARRAADRRRHPGRLRPDRARFFSFEAAGIVPDLVALSKSISGFGLPMALLLIRPQWDSWEPGEHNGTFRGNAHAFVTARVALEKFWADDRLVPGRGAARPTCVDERLARIARCSCPGARVKGRGMMQGARRRATAAVGRGDLPARRRRAGLIIESSGPHDEVVKILAPLTTPDELLRRGLDIVADAVAAATARAVAVCSADPSAPPAWPEPGASLRRSRTWF